MSRNSQPDFWFERMVSVRRGQEPELARLFNITLVSSIPWILINAVFLLARLKNRTALDAFIAYGIFGVGLIGTLAMMWLVKRGHFRPLASWYLRLLYILILAGTVLFGGGLAPALVLMIWVLVAGIFFLPRPQVVVRMLLLALLVWAAGGIAQQFGYQLYGRDAQLMAQLFAGFTVSTLVATVFMLYYAVRYLRTTMANLEHTTEELEVYRRTLEQQVLERTADAERRAEEFRAVAELNQITAEATNLSAMLGQVVRDIARRFGFYQADIFLVDESGQWVVMAANSSIDGDILIERAIRLRIGQEGLIGQAAADRRPHVANDVSQNPYYMPVPELPDTRSEAVLPLIVHDQVVGILDLQSREVDAFTEADLRVLQVMTNNLAMAIENVRRFEQAQRALERLYRFQEEDVLKLWRKTLQRRGTSVAFLYNRVQFSALPAAAQPFGELPPLEGDMVTARSAEGGYLLMVPLRVHGRISGRFTFESDRPWNDEEKGLVEAVMGQLGLALENVGLLEETRQRALFEKLSGQIAANVRAETEVDAMLHRALKELGQVLGAEQAVASLKLRE